MAFKIKTPKVKEKLSDWFIEGLKEIGITKEEYQKSSSSDKKSVKNYLKQLGHSF